MNIEDCRKEIDRTDEELLKLFEKRMALCKQIGVLKKAEGRKVFDADREKAKSEWAASFSDPALLPYSLKFMHTLMDLSKDYQNEE